jgi:hypothetical protein
LFENTQYVGFKAPDHFVHSCIGERGNKMSTRSVQTLIGSFGIVYSILFRCVQALNVLGILICDTCVCYMPIFNIFSKAGINLYLKNLDPLKAVALKRQPKKVVLNLVLLKSNYFFVMSLKFEKKKKANF